MTLKKINGFLIKDAGNDELKDLIPIYKKVFKKHNIFERGEGEILKYLQKKNQINSEKGGGYILAKDGAKVIGGLLIRKAGEDKKNKHINWRYNHIAVHPEWEGKGIGSALVEAADKKIKKLINGGKANTSKIEIRVSENEEGSLDFYKKNGFKVEGELKSHYRYGETVYALGKEIERNQK